MRFRVLITLCLKACTCYREIVINSDAACCTVYIYVTQSPMQLNVFYTLLPAAPTAGRCFVVGPPDSVTIMNCDVDRYELLFCIDITFSLDTYASLLIIVIPKLSCVKFFDSLEGIVS